MNSMSEEQQKYQQDVGTLLHNLLFSYQKSLKTILGKGAESFVDPTIQLLLNIDREDNLKLVSSDTLEEALTNFAAFLEKSGVVKECNWKKTGYEKYVFNVHDCLWAKCLHKTIQPKDVVCPFGLVAMAIYKRYMKGTVNERESFYLSNGSETILEPLLT